MRQASLKLSRGRSLDLSASPRLMGILNLTPDSFSDGGLCKSPQLALGKALAMLDDGADIIDVGGESTRPGAADLSSDEEAARVLPALRIMRDAKPDCVISVDTRKSDVASAALEAGADIINDISGLSHSPDIPSIVARHNAAIVIMHMRGNPTTMQRPENLVYGDIVHDISSTLRRAADLAIQAGVDPSSIMLDPGLGFSKAPDQNFELMRRADEFLNLGMPMLWGPSRKSFIGMATGESDPSMRDYGTAGVIAWLAIKGAHILRVHNVRAARHCIASLLACQRGKKSTLP